MESCQKILRNLITPVYFKDWKWIPKTVYCISCSMVCRIICCSEFPDIPDKAGRKTRKRRRTQVIAECYAFHANAVNDSSVHNMRQIDSHLFIRTFSSRSWFSLVRYWSPWNYKITCILILVFWQTWSPYSRCKKLISAIGFKWLEQDSNSQPLSS